MFKGSTEIYNESDVTLLADVIEMFIKTIIIRSKLLFYFSCLHLVLHGMLFSVSSSGFTWDAD